MRSITTPREGSLLPSFELPRSDGGTLRPRAYRGRRSLALVFVHAASCPGCRAYLGGALEVYGAFAEETAEVVAVVPGDPESVSALRRDLALPFPVVIDADGATFRRYGLMPGEDAAVMVTDRYGEPRLWQVADQDHSLVAHADRVAELRYLALTCAGGCSIPLWSDVEGESPEGNA